MRFDLQKYNRVVWAILGTLGLLGLAALLVGGLTELWPSRHTGPSVAAVEPARGTDGPASPAAQPLRLGLPSDLPGTGLVLVPVEATEPDQGGGGGFGSYSKGGSEAPLVNLVFVDPKTGASQQLLDRKALITQHEVLTDLRGNLSQANGQVLGQTLGLALRMVSVDTNGNGRLDGGDEEKVYLCDPTGRGLREVLPAGATCARWEFDAARRTLFVLMHPKGKADPGVEILSVPLDASLAPKPLLDMGRIKALQLLLQR